MRKLASGPGLRKFAVLTAVGGAMLLGSISAASAASASAAAPAPNASADAHGLRVTGLGGPNKITVRAVSGQNLFLVTDTAPISADIGCAPATVQAGLFGVHCRALPGSGGTQFRSFSVNGGGGDDTVTNFAPAAMRADGGAGKTSSTAAASVTSCATHPATTGWSAASARTS
jgi:hypothetical protein